MHINHRASLIDCHSRTNRTSRDLVYPYFKSTILETNYPLTLEPGDYIVKWTAGLPPLVKVAELWPGHSEVVSPITRPIGVNICGALIVELS